MNRSTAVQAGMKAKQEGNDNRGGIPPLRNNGMEVIKYNQLLAELEILVLLH